MPKMDIKDLGKKGELIAANYLQKNGYDILTMNFANELGYRRGELDIVAKDLKSEEIVFVEVKALQKKTYSVNPEKAISRQKYQKLSKIISNYINRNKIYDCAYRLDAISIEFDLAKRKASLRHLKHIYY
jgi:putative endonuclease